MEINQKAFTGFNFIKHEMFNAYRPLEGYTLDEIVTLNLKDNVDFFFFDKMKILSVKSGVYSNSKRDHHGRNAAKVFLPRLHREVKVHVYSKRNIAIAV